MEFIFLGLKIIFKFYDLLPIVGAYKNFKFGGKIRQLIFKDIIENMF